MSCYFITCTYFRPGTEREEYDDYIRLVRPIVEKYGGSYLLRSENIEYLSERWKPGRVIIIEFPTRENLNRCFLSEEYKRIKNKRINTVESRAIIADNPLLRTNTEFGEVTE